jgi:iron complex outermembrane receptor protein
LDLTVEYRRDLGWGDLRWAGQFTWQFEDKVGLFADRITDGNGTVGEPKFVGNTNLQIRRGDWTHFWGTDIVGEASEGDFVGNIVSAPLYGGQTLLKINTELTIYHDLSARWSNDGWSITGGIANVFNELPPAVSNELNAGRYGKFGTVADVSQYDILGRRAFVNVSYEF